MPIIELTYKKDTWGSYGQHTMTVDSVLQNGSFVAAWDVPGAELDDQSCHSNKNTHSNKIFKLDLPVGTIVRRFERYQSSGRREQGSTYLSVADDATLYPVASREFKRDGAIFVEIEGQEICVWRRN